MSIKNCKENQENHPTQNDTTIFRGFTAEEVINQKKSYWQDEKISQNYNANVKIDNKLFSKITFPLYKQFIKPTDRVLDMGTGTGRLSISLAEMGCEVVACDISKEMLNHIYIYISQHNLDNLSLVLADAETFNFDELGKFDVVTSLWFISHFPNWSKYLHQQLKCCKVGGYVIFDIHNADHLHLCKKYPPNKTLDLMGFGYNSYPSRKELEEFAEKSGASIEKIIPFDMLRSNAIIFNALTDVEYDIFKKCIVKLYEAPLISDALIRFEHAVVHKLAPEYTDQNLVVLKKLKEIE